MVLCLQTVASVEPPVDNCIRSGAIVFLKEMTHA